MLSFRGLEAAIAANPQLEGAKPISIKTPEISGVLCSRFEIELGSGDVAWRQLAYILPGGKRWASLVLGAPPDRYQPLAKELDALVEKLSGIAKVDESVREEGSQESLGKLGSAITRGALIGLTISALVRTLYKRARKKERERIAKQSSEDA